MRTNAEAFSSLTWAVTIGIGRYPADKLPDLPSPPHDAQALASALTDEQGCAIPARQVIAHLVNEQATKQAVVAALQHTAQQIPPHGTLLVYFAGHGLSAEGHFYLCTADTDLDNLPETAIADFEIDVIFQDCLANGVLLVLDCCQSAGFAEIAPNFFRTLGKGEFRILLSASRANEPSWELSGGRGTIFSNHLLKVIKGEEEISTTPGLIYFSELLQHLQQQVAEDLELHYPEVPKQEPVFAGVYTKDPLLFVHRRLTLKQIAVSTARYSRVYIRRLVSRIITGVIFLLAFAAATFYTILDNYQYVVSESRGLTIYRGYPGYNAFGFPKREWVLDIQAENKIENSPLTQNRPIVSRLGKPVLPLLLENLKPEARAMVLYWQGKDEAARIELKKVLTGDSLELPQKALIEAADLFSKIAVEADLPIFHRLRGSNITSVKVAALKGLIRLAPDQGLELATKERFPEYTGPTFIGSSHSEIVSSLSGSCRPTVEAYFSSLLKKAGYTAAHACVIDAALRLGCDLSTEDLAVLLLAEFPSADTNVSTYASVAQKGDLTKRILNYLRNKAERPDKLASALQALGALPVSACDPILWEYLDDRDAAVRRSAVTALLRQCGNFSPKLQALGRKEELLADPYIVAELAKHKLVGWQTVIDVVHSTNNQTEKNSLIESLRQINSPDAIPALMALLKDKSLYYLVKETTLVTLRELNAPPTQAPDFFRDESASVERAAYKWYGVSHPRETVNALVARFNEENIDYIPEILREIQLREEELNTIRQFLRSGSITEVKNATAIIAMQGSPAEVKRLLASAEFEVRKTVVGHLPYHKRFNEIARSIEPSVDHPDWVYRRVKEQLQMKSEIERELSHTPHWMKAWRIELWKSTRYFNTLGQKMWADVAGITSESALDR